MQIIHSKLASRIIETGTATGSLPDFIIIGSQRCGTTTLHRVLGLHPQVFTTPVKELYFFTDRNYHRGLRWYQRHFSQRNGEKVAGESSPDYILSETVAQRIKQHLPEAKLILTVRNPVERAYSAYWFHRVNLVETHRTFEDALEADLGYIDRGFYLQHIQKYFKHFAREQVLVVLNDDLRDDPNGVYQRCFDFLGVDDSVIFPEMGEALNRPGIHDTTLYNLVFQNPSWLKVLPPGTGARRLVKYGRRRPFKHPPMNPDTRQRLVETFQRPNAELGAFLGRDLSHWSS